MLYIIYQEDGEGSAEIRAKTRPEHFAYLEKHKDILVLGGALIPDDESNIPTGSCLIINVPSRAAADEFSNNEPLRKAGTFKSVKITRMRRGQWNPDAAPKSALGN